MEIPTRNLFIKKIITSLREKRKKKEDEMIQLETEEIFVMIGLSILYNLGKK